MKTSKAELLSLFAFFVSAFLPYVRTSPFESDLQPHSVVLFTVLLASAFFVTRRVPIGIHWIGAAVGYFSLAMLLDAALEVAIAVSLLFLTIGYLNSFPAKEKAQLARTLGHAAAAAVCVYFLFTVVDIFFGKGVLESLVGNLRYSRARGVNSLASEPSYLGVVSVCLIFILEVSRIRNFRIYQFVGFACLLSSGSFYAIGPAIVIVAVYFLRDLSARNVIIASIFCLLLLPLSQLSPDRLQTVVDNLMNLDFYFQDQSTVNRLARSFLPIYSALIDFFVPHSLERVSFSDVGQFDRYLYVDFSVERISNISSVFLYGFGFFSFPAIYFYLKKSVESVMPLYFYALTFYLFTANISTATPYVFLVFAVPYFVRRRVPQRASSSRNVREQAVAGRERHVRRDGRAVRRQNS